MFLGRVYENIKNKKNNANDLYFICDVNVFIDIESKHN